MSDLEEILQPEKPWLEQQAEFRAGWREGLRWLQQTIDTWGGAYVNALNVQSAAARDPLAWQRPLAGAFVYHWGQAVGRTGGKVAGAGVKEALNEKLHGDPLRDVVLACTAVLQDEAALATLYAEYEPVFNRSVQQHWPDTSTPPVAWVDLFSRLVVGTAGEGSSPAEKLPLLDQYHGYGTLRTWLQPCARHYLLNEWRRSHRPHRRQQPLAQEPTAMALSPERRLELSEEARDIRAAIASAFRQLPPDDRELLFLAHRAGWSNIKLAQVLETGTGQSTRKRQRALRTFAELVLKSLSEASWDREELRRLEALWTTRPATIGLLLSDFDNRWFDDHEQTLKREGAAERPLLTMQQQLAKPPEPPGPKTLTRPQQVPSPQPVAVDGPGNQLAGLLPDNVRVVPVEALTAGTGAFAPETLHETEMRQAPELRPPVVLLDGRGLTRIEPVLHWLERFDAVAYRNESAPWLPQRVVLLALGFAAPKTGLWKDRADVDWIVVKQEDQTMLALKIYERYLRDGLGALLNPPQRTFYHSGTANDPMTPDEFVPASQRAEWDAQMAEMERRQ
jgi:RNA polymerase sigma factor (sigma-70 family)